MPDTSVTIVPATPSAGARPSRAPTPRVTTPADLDRLLHAWQSRFTGGRSPSTISLAFRDWTAHAMNAPFQMTDLGRTALVQWQRLTQAAIGGTKAIAPQPGDHRFAHPAWQKPPYDLLTQAVLLGEEWWDSVARAPGGVGRPNERLVAFTVRQWLDMVSPS